MTFESAPKSWRKVSLSDCCKIISGATPRRDNPEYWGGSIPWVTPKDLSKLEGSIIEDAPEYITEKGYRSCSTDLLPKGSVLFSSRAPIGHVAIAGRPMCTNQGFKSLIPGDDLDSSYLYWCLRKLVPEISARGTGTTFKEVSKAVMEEFEIPLPPLPEQKRIAAILDKADSIRRKRQEAVRLTEELLRSVFLEMFGDPVTNPKGWETGVLGDVIFSAKDGPHVSPEYSDDGIPFLSARHVKPGRIEWNDLKHITIEEAKIHWKKCKPEKGDILYTKGGTTGVAAVFDSDEEIAVWVHIALLKLKENKVNPYWLENMLNSKYCYDQSQRYTHGITNQDLGLKRMVNIEMYIPSLSEQNKFHEVMQKTKNLASLSASYFKESENAFNSLLQRAFKGEL